MRVQDLKVGETYRHHNHPAHCYAKVVRILKKLKEYEKRSAFDLTEEEKNVKQTVVKVEWTLNKNDTCGLIKYFRPCDLIKDDHSA